MEYSNTADSSVNKLQLSPHDVASGKQHLTYKNIASLAIGKQSNQDY